MKNLAVLVGVVLLSIVAVLLYGNKQFTVTSGSGPGIVVDTSKATMSSAELADSNNAKALVLAIDANTKAVASVRKQIAVSLPLDNGKRWFLPWTWFWRGSAE